MRRLFNDGHYWEQVQSGAFTEVLMEDRLAPPASGEPPGTRSQMMSYRDGKDNEIARVHRYLRPDGSLGASGKPDPKRLLKDNVLYRLQRLKDR